MFSLCKKIIITILISSLLLVSCSHTATLLVPKENAGKSEWFTYYEDQFKEFGDEVPDPDANATEAQKTAHYEAKKDWEHAQNISMWIGIGALAITIPMLIMTLSQASELD